MRVDPASGQAQQLGTWPRLGVFDQHWLVVDRDGGVLLVASSSLLRKHTVVRFWVQPETQPQVTLVRFGKRAVAMMPWVDALGYSFPVTIKQDALPQVVRLDKLDARPGRWNDVSRCVQ